MVRRQKDSEAQKDLNTFFLITNHFNCCKLPVPSTMASYLFLDLLIKKMKPTKNSKKETATGTTMAITVRDEPVL